MFSGSIWLSAIVGVCVALTTIFITYIKWSLGHWKRKGLPYVEPQFFFGNLQNPLKVTDTVGVVVKKVYDELQRRNLKHGGLYFFAKPEYMAVDLDYVKNILTKDFQHFTDRGIYYNEKIDPLGAHLFAIGGIKWRNLRMKLTPTFTSGKMKMMFQILLDTEKNLQGTMEAFYRSKEPVDIKEVLGCFTTDIIGSCAFGLECNTFKERNSPFREYGKRVFTASVKRKFLIGISQMIPDIARMMGIRQIEKDVADFFMKVVKETVEYREKNNVSRKDFLQLLIEMKNNPLAEESGYQHDGQTLTLEEVAAQCFVFFLAGFETSSTTMTFALYELAKNPEIQEKLRKEVNEVLDKHDNEISYQAIQDMKYMNQIIDETLRKYPPVPFITRECVKDYKTPGEDFIIEKGVTAIVSILGIHYDKKHYPDPEIFDPERFNENNSKTRHPYAHIPFGEGPRICIGLRFGLMQTKVGLASLLRKYKFTVNQKTKEPLKFATNSFILATEGDVWLDVEKI